MSSFELVKGIKEQNAAALSKAMSIIESSRIDHQEQAAEILAALTPNFGKAFRIGVCGAPGVGKSSFIEKLVKKIVSNNPRYKVAVLAVDPSSPTHGGSVLGDLTRMGELLGSNSVFFRALPSRGESSVNPKLADFLGLCDGFGCDFIVIETVGIGQADYVIRYFSDHLVLLEQPGSGDDVQAMKSGLVEIADSIFVSKADGALTTVAEKSLIDYKGRLRGSSKVLVESYSLHKPEKLDKILDNLLSQCKFYEKQNTFTLDRQKRHRKILEYYLKSEAWTFLQTLADFSLDLESLTKKMKDQNLSPSVVGRLLFSSWQKKMEICNR